VPDAAGAWLPGADAGGRSHRLRPVLATVCTLASFRLSGGRSPPVTALLPTPRCRPSVTVQVLADRRRAAGRLPPPPRSLVSFHCAKAQLLADYLRVTGQLLGVIDGGALPSGAALDYRRITWELPADYRGVTGQLPVPANYLGVTGRLPGRVAASRLPSGDPLVGQPREAHRKLDGAGAPRLHNHLRTVTDAEVRPASRSGKHCSVLG